MMIRFDIVKYFSYWCFGQFYDSRIKVLQIAQLLALVIFGSVSLMRQNLTELIERKFKKHKIQTLRWPLEAAKCSGVALSPSRKLISIRWSSTIHLMQLKQPICAAAWRGAMPSENRIKIVRASYPAVKMFGQLFKKNSEETLTKG